jgi:hypothetical protein
MRMLMAGRSNAANMDSVRQVILHQHIAGFTD